MFEPELFRQQMYCIEENTCDIVGTFRRPGHCAPLFPLVTPLGCATAGHDINNEFLFKTQEMIQNRSEMQRLTNKWYEEVRSRPSPSDEEDETEI